MVVFDTLLVVFLASLQEPIFEFQVFGCSDVPGDEVGKRLLSLLEVLFCGNLRMMYKVMELLIT